MQTRVFLGLLVIVLAAIVCGPVSLRGDQAPPVGLTRERLNLAWWFLPKELAKKITGKEFRIRNNTLEAFDGATWNSISPLPAIANVTSFKDSVGSLIFDAPAIPTQTEMVDFQGVDDGRGIVRAAQVNSTTYLFQEQTILEKGDFKNSLKVYKKSQGTLQKLQQLDMISDPYNMFLSGAICLSPRYIAVLLSSRHQYMKSVGLFDTTQDKIVSFLDYSEGTFDPSTGLLSLSEVVPDSVNAKDILKKVSQNPLVLKLNNEALPMEDKDLSEFTNMPITGASKP